MNDDDVDWTIALVDDHSDSRELLRYALRRRFRQARIIEPSSVQSLLQMVPHQLAAVVTRYKLFGEINGLELTHQLRSAGFKSRIIMLSNAEEIAGAALAAGVDEFLSYSRWAELPDRLAAQLALADP